MCDYTFSSAYLLQATTAPREVYHFPSVCVEPGMVAGAEHGIIPEVPFWARAIAQYAHASAVAGYSMTKSIACHDTITDGESRNELGFAQSRDDV